MKIKLAIKNHASKIVFSLGMGGILALYIVEFCRIRIIPNLKNPENLSEFLLDNNLIMIHPIEVVILISSIVAIILAPLLKSQNAKTIKMFSLIVFLFFELIAFMSVMVYQEISLVFILSTTITSIYLIWIAMDILQIIYNWIKIDKKIEEQVDVVKLTFILAIIAFLLGLLR